MSPVEPADARRASERAMACVQRVNGADGLTLDHAVEAVDHVLTALTRRDMHLLVAMMAARLAGSEAREAASPSLALSNVRRALADHDEAVAAFHRRTVEVVA